MLIDNRGTCYCFHPEKIEDFTIAAMADDVHAVVEDLAISSIHLLGYSLGGCIAQQYAARHPERLQSLILLSTTGRGSLYAPPGRDSLSNLENPKGTTPWEMALHMWSLCVSESAVEKFKTELSKNHERQMLKATPRRTFAGQMRAFRSFAPEKRFANGCPVPVTIISGKNDLNLTSSESVDEFPRYPYDCCVSVGRMATAPSFGERAGLRGHFGKARPAHRHGFCVDSSREGG